MRPSPSAPSALVIASLFAVLTPGAGSARAEPSAQNAKDARIMFAQIYPWCLMSSAFDGGENCGFSTFDQCMASRLGIGGFCQANTLYQGGAAPGPAPRPAHRIHQPS